MSTRWWATLRNPSFAALRRRPYTRRMRWTRGLVALGLWASVTGCAEGVSATFDVGVEAAVDASEVALPAELRDDEGSAPSVRAVPCGPMGMCPSTDEVPVTCEADVCDPAPITIAEPVGDVVDFDEITSELEIVRRIERVELLEASYNLTSNTFTLPVGEIELHWGPAGAVDLDPAQGVQRLGVLPPIAAGATGEGPIVLDAAGSEALSDYVAESEARLRFFARTTLDVDPGDPFPAGRVDVEVKLRVRVRGKLL